MRRDCTLGRFVLACVVLTLLSTNARLEAFPPPGPGVGQIGQLGQIGQFGQLGIGPGLGQDAIFMPVQNSTITTFALSECIVIGKVKSIETEPVIAPTSPYDQYQTIYKVAVVDVAETLAGDKTAKTVRVGFRLVNKKFKNPLGPALGQPGIGLAPIEMAPAADLEVGQEGCFVLSKHYEQSFFVMEGTNGFGGLAMFGLGFGNDGALIKKGTKAYDSDVPMMRRCSKIMYDSKAALKSKDAEERLLALAILITKYRTPPAGDIFGFGGLGFGMGGQAQPMGKTKPIDADESKLILEALAQADLSRSYDAKLKISALGLFLKLGLTKADGWDQNLQFGQFGIGGLGQPGIGQPGIGRPGIGQPGKPMNPNELTDAARKWLKDHSAKYRILRLVAEKTTP